MIDDITNPRTLELLRVYKEELEKADAAEPRLLYFNPGEAFSSVIPYILRGGYSKNTPIWKATCKRLKIAHTYKAINAYMKGA